MGKAQSKLSQETLTELSQQTRFTAKDLAQWHKGFSKDCPNPAGLQKRDFVALYKQYYPFGDATQYATFCFELYDRNKDGFLSFEEFILALDVCAKGSLDEKLELAFKLYDLDEGTAQSLVFLTSNRRLHWEGGNAVYCR